MASKSEMRAIRREQGRHLWFLSDEFMGSKVSLEPRIPERRNEKQSEDMTIKRICVSNRVEDCIQLLPMFDFSEKKYAYRVDGKAHGVSVELPRKLVPDWNYENKNEVWLLKPNNFTYVGMLESVQNMGSLTWLEMVDSSMPYFNLSNYLSNSITESERVRVHHALEIGCKPSKGNDSLNGFSEATVKAYELTKHQFLGTKEWIRALEVQEELRSWSEKAEQKIREQGGKIFGEAA